MDYNDVLKNAKNNMESCKVCPTCNGIACRGDVPGAGGKGTGSGFIRNYEKLKEIKLNMDTIYEPNEVDTSVELFGKTFKYPIFAAPIGGLENNYGNKYSDEEYQDIIVNGCINSGIAGFTGDGVKDEYFYKPLEVIGSNEGWGIPTIKPWKKEEILAKVKASEEKGAIAIAMDVDAAGLVTLARLGKPVEPKSKETLAEIINSTKTPFIIKGIMTVNGALKALEAGAYGIVVSNHGGRVLDETPSTIEVLPEIVEAVKGKMKIFIDGGFRSGRDVFKAIAMGADAVLIGRPYAIAAYGGGIEGVELYTNKIGSELHDAMLMTGAENLKAINRSFIRV